MPVPFMRGNYLKASDLPKDHYSTLGVPPGATAEEVRVAYRRLAREWHPDKNPGQESETRFKQLSEAYEILASPRQRKAYDEKREHLLTPIIFGQSFRRSASERPVRRSSYSADPLFRNCPFTTDDMDKTPYQEMQEARRARAEELQRRRNATMKKADSFSSRERSPAAARPTPSPARKPRATPMGGSTATKARPPPHPSALPRQPPRHPTAPSKVLQDGKTYAAARRKAAQRAVDIKRRMQPPQSPITSHHTIDLNRSRRSFTMPLPPTYTRKKDAW
eukprot:Sspe_Gene.112681::Locus_95841_Transcript_1_1_Confidence_1.000_Length_1025::g.112681::m.112681